MATHALQRPAVVALTNRISLTKAEAAQSAGVSTRFLEKEAKAGRLRVHKAGRKILIRPTDLDAWLEARAQD